MLTSGKIRYSASLIGLEFSLLLIAVTCIAQNTAPTAEKGAANTSPMLGGGFYDLTNTPIAYIRGYDYSCTGVLVGERHVLTAAHCIVYTADTYTVYVAASAHSVAEEWYLATYDHDGGAESSNSRYDLGMLVLTTPVVGVRPIPVLYDDAVTVGETAGVLGFGTNELSGLLDDLSSFYQGKIGLVKIEYADDGMLTSTTDYSNASTCGGDSGGPLVQLFGESRFLAVVGIVSTGTNTYDYWGNCILGYKGISNFVDLQSSSSRGFIANWPDISRLSGGFVKFLFGAEACDQMMQQMPVSRKLRRLKSNARKAAKEFKRLRVYADAKRLQVLNTILRFLKKASKARSARRALRLIDKVNPYSKVLVGFGVD